MQSSGQRSHALKRVLFHRGRAGCGAASLNPIPFFAVSAVGVAGAASERRGRSPAVRAAMAHGPCCLFLPACGRCGLGGRHHTAIGHPSYPKPPLISS